MASKETPEIRKPKRASKPIEDTKRVIVVDTGVSGGLSVASEFLEEEIDEFLEKTGLTLFLTKARAPTLDERPGDYPEGWVVLYECPFMIGYKFPLNPLMTKLLTTLQVSPAQIMPLAWRVVHVINELTRDMDMEFGLDDLLY